MEKQENQKQNGKKPVAGGWVLLFFAVLFATILIMGFLFN